MLTYLKVMINDCQEVVDRGIYEEKPECYMNTGSAPNNEVVCPDNDKCITCPWWLHSASNKHRQSMLNKIKILEAIDVSD